MSTAASNGLLTRGILGKRRKTCEQERQRRCSPCCGQNAERKHDGPRSGLSVGLTETEPRSKASTNSAGARRELSPKIHRDVRSTVPTRIRSVAGFHRRTSDMPEIGNRKRWRSPSFHSLAMLVLSHSLRGADRSAFTRLPSRYTRNGIQSPRFRCIVRL